MKSENRRLIYTQEVPLSGRSASVFKAVFQPLLFSANTPICLICIALKDSCNTCLEMLRDLLYPFLLRLPVWASVSFCHLSSSVSLQNKKRRFVSTLCNIYEIICSLTYCPEVPVMLNYRNGFDIHLLNSYI